jgi:hypothetical protein
MEQFGTTKVTPPENKDSMSWRRLGVELVLFSVGEETTQTKEDCASGSCVCNWVGCVVCVCAW